MSMRDLQVPRHGAHLLDLGVIILHNILYYKSYNILYYTILHYYTIIIVLLLLLLIITMII